MSDANEQIWDAYNLLLLSGDTGRLQKLNARYELFMRTRDVPGSIIECGVFKGAGWMHWLKLLRLYAPHEKKMVFGFDTFSSFSGELESYEVETAKKFVDEAAFAGINAEKLEADAHGSGFTNGHLISGEVSETIPQFVNDMPGLRLSLVNLDFDTYTGTKVALENFYPIMSPGGIFVLDEYGKQGWGESDAVDEFLAGKDLTIEAVRHSDQPTAIIRVGNNRQ